MSATDDLLAAARQRAERLATGDLPPQPARRIAIVGCMDARLELASLFGLKPGDAHVIRNAGGLITEDVVRSVMLSQRLLGTTEVMVVQHTRCGLLGLDEAAVVRALREETGREPAFDLGGFDDLDANVRRSVELLRNDELLPHRDAVRGFVYDVATGELREVDPV
jgi:carbonic anhydrase